MYCAHDQFLQQQHMQIPPSNPIPMNAKVEHQKPQPIVPNYISKSRINLSISVEPPPTLLISNWKSYTLSPNFK